MLEIASASGNLFAYARAEGLPPGLDLSAWSQRLCRRGSGLGLDGLFVVSPYLPGRPWAMEHYEPDGSRTFCSNGSRAASVLLPQGFEGHLPAQVSGTDILLEVSQSGVFVRLPEGPGFGFLPVQVGLEVPHAYGWTGTPHLAVEWPGVADLDLEDFASPLRHHPSLPQGANVSVLEILEPGLARIRSWERGVEGETLCCGQGCAVAGAWLAGRTGLRTWTFLPRGEDPVTVEVGRILPEGWEGLRVGGPIRRLGQFQPGPALEPR